MSETPHGADDVHFQGYCREASRMGLRSPTGLCTLLLWCVLCLNLPAQESRTRFGHLSSTDGLSQTTVLQITQDKRGFMWFATQDGLNRYDGYRFKVYRHDPENPRSLSDDWINMVYEDSGGTLWVATGMGLNRFEREYDTFQRFQSGLEKKGVLYSGLLVIEDGGDDTLWLGTRHNGVIRFNKKDGTFDLQPFSDGRNIEQLVAAICRDRNGTLWFGSNEGGGLYRSNGGDDPFTRVDGLMVDGQVVTNVNKIFEDAGGTIWVGSDMGLFRKRGESSSFEYYPFNDVKQDGRLDNRVSDITEDKRGRLWLGGRQGVIRLDPLTGDFIRYQHNPVEPDSLSEDIVLSLFSDRTGVVWLGTLSQGINTYHYSREVFKLYRNNPLDDKTLSDNRIYSILRDRGGALWVGTQKGLNRYDRRLKRFIAYFHEPDDPNSLSDSKIMCILEDRSGGLWLGTGNGGLTHFDRQAGRFTRFNDRKGENRSFPARRVWSVLEDRDGYIWIGAGRGLARLDRVSDTVEIANQVDGNGETQPIDVVRYVFEDRNRNLWVGTDGNGVGLRMKGETHFRMFRNNPDDETSLSDDRARVVAEDEDGNIWIGTSLGLNLYHPETKTFTRYRERDGFKNDVIYGVLPDGLGHLWISTNMGVARFNRHSGEVKTFDVGDGLQENEFTIGAFFRDVQSGEMFFGGHKGLTAFFPDQIKADPYAPQIVLSDFRLFNDSVTNASLNPGSLLSKTIEEAESIELSYHDYLFELEFAALHYDRPEKNRYAFKMEGLDKDWIEVSSGRRFVSYTQLNAGEYVFRVKAANKDGVWSEESQGLRIKIEPPIWLSWWAFLAYSVAIVLGILAFLRSQREKLERERSVNRLKDEILANTSHELRTPLNGIVGITESLLAGVAGPVNDRMKNNMEMVISCARRLTSLVNDILDFTRLKQTNLQLRPEPLDFRTLTEVIFKLSEPLLGERQIELVNAVSAELPPVEADENRLMQVMHNLVGNAIKFTESGTITVNAERFEGRITVSVKDTGVGIPKENQDRIFESFEQVDKRITRVYDGAGLGLAITKRLVMLHGGRIWVESRKGQGATFFFTLPVAVGSLKKKAGRLSEKLQKIVPTRRHLPVSENFELDSIMGAGGAFRILIVDDDPVNRQVLANHLSVQNFRVIQASGGHEAIRLVEQSNGAFDLILLDVMMPKISGFEVCQKLRLTYPMHELPIIFLTAKDQNSDQVAGFASGANDYLIKPFTKEQLLARVGTHLRLLDINRTLEQRVIKRTREMEARNQELETLDQIVKTINREVTFQRVLETVLEQGLALFPQTERGTFLLWSDKEGMFEIAASAGYDRETLGRISFSFDELVNRYTKGTEEIAPDIYLVNNLEEAAASEKLQHIDMPKCILAMAVILDGSIQGFLVLSNFQDRQAFVHSDGAKLSRFREHALSAVAKAHFLQEMEEKNAELLRTQEQLVMKEKLASLGTLTAGMAHEVNTPVGIGLTASSYLYDQTRTLIEHYRNRELTEDELDHYLRNCEQTVELLMKNMKKAGEMIQSFKKIAGDHASGLNRRFNVKDYLQEVVWSIGMELQESGHRVVVRGVDNCEIIGNPDSFSQLIVHLVQNSLQHAYPNGRKGNLAFELTRNGKGFKLVYTDDGAGIDEENLKRIFDPFFTTRRGDGHTGLGLHLVYNIVTHQLGGSIECSSEKGRGTSFVVRVPA